MKRIIPLFLSVVLLFIMLGCQNESKSKVKSFYYPRTDLGYHALEDKFASSAIQAELRNDIPYQSGAQILAEYFKGPLTPSLSNPFPTGLTLTDINIQGAVLYLTVSDHLASLQDIPLVIACACLSQTAMSVTGTSTVCINCESSLLNGEKFVIMNADSLILDDPILTEPNE